MPCRKAQQVKSAVSFISDYENQLAKVAKARKCHGIICGHIHQPVIKMIDGIEYMNSGDWVENLTALEYHQGNWSIYRYNEDAVAQKIKLSKHARNTLDNDEIFKDLVNEFVTKKKWKSFMPSKAPATGTWAVR